MDREVLQYQLDKRVDEGLIRRALHPTLPLRIYSYTAECQWRGAWDKYTMMARGLILDAAGTVVARPFPKFYNYGEKCCPEPPRLPFKVWEKLDGSLLIGFNYEGAWHVSTRGSFDNQFVDYGSQFLPQLEPFPHHYTICMEVCMPPDLDGLERAVPHRPGVYLLGAVDLYSGKDMELDRISSTWNPEFLPRLYDGTPEALSELARKQVDTEGWVLRWSNGFRIKIKTAWYYRLFRAICRLEETVRDGMLKGEKKEEILKEVPEELRADAENIYRQVRKHVLAREQEVIGLTLEHWQDDKKQFAHAVHRHPQRALMLMCYEDQDLAEVLIEEAVVTRT